MLLGLTDGKCRYVSARPDISNEAALLALAICRLDGLRNRFRMPETTASKTWLVTGASQGLGLAIALSALKSGHNVIAGARNPDVAATDHPEVVTAGGKWLQLDVSLPSTKDVVQQAVKEAGGIDVVVNNAGYFLAGQIEDLT